VTEVRNIGSHYGAVAKTPTDRPGWGLIEEFVSDRHCPKRSFRSRRGLGAEPRQAARSEHLFRRGAIAVARVVAVLDPRTIELLPSVPPFQPEAFTNSNLSGENSRYSQVWVCGSRDFADSSEGEENMTPGTTNPVAGGRAVSLYV